MQTTINHDGDVTTIIMSGSFTFGDNQQFRSTLKDLQDARPQRVILDFSNVEFIDSAALGMLLLLRDTLYSKGTALELHKAQGQIRKMFELSNFNELFTIVD